MQRSSVRFNSGGSGSFVSADGLVMNLIETRQITPESLANIQKMLEASRREKDVNDKS